MKKFAGKVRVSLEEVRKLKGRSNIPALLKQQNEEKAKSTPEVADKKSL